MKPLNKRLLIELDEPEAVSAGGIIIPETAKEKPQIGKVIAASDESFLHPGERVVFMKFAARPSGIDNQVFVNEEDLEAKFVD